MTLFTMDPTTGYLTYQATISIDDHQSTSGAQIGTNGYKGVLLEVEHLDVRLVVLRIANGLGREPDGGQVLWPRVGAVCRGQKRILL
jgi:hypothetical protein